LRPCVKYIIPILFDIRLPEEVTDAESVLRLRGMRLRLLLRSPARVAA